MDVTRQRHKIMGTFGIKKQLCSYILQAQSAHQGKGLPQSHALSSPLPWDWRTEVRGEVITSEEHTRAVATTPNENVKRQARYKSHPTGHINEGHRGVASRKDISIRYKHEPFELTIKNRKILS